MKWAPLKVFKRAVRSISDLAIRAYWFISGGSLRNLPPKVCIRGHFMKLSSISFKSMCVQTA